MRTTWTTLLIALAVAACGDPAPDCRSTGCKPGWTCRQQTTHTVPGIPLPYSSKYYACQPDSAPKLTVEPTPEVSRGPTCPSGSCDAPRARLGPAPGGPRPAPKPGGGPKPAPDAPVIPPVNMPPPQPASLLAALMVGR